MSALAEALVAAQRRAVAQLEKEFVRSRQEDPAQRAEGLREALAAIGLPDRTDADALINCLEVLRITGGDLPSEPANGASRKPENEQATDAQLTLVNKLLKEKNATPPDLPLTKAQAHEVIDTLKAGTYDQNKWTVPF